MSYQLERIPVTIVTGFLGSGKTTLLNRLLRDREFRDSAVLVNEIGEIGIDHQLIGAAKDRVLLLEGGCLCCVMADSLRETLAELYHRRGRDIPAFDRVLVETSGLADPGPIVQTLLKDSLVAPWFVFASVVCVVDALHAQAQLRQNVEAREQVALADRILISKLDACGNAIPPQLLHELKALNSAAEVISLLDSTHSAAQWFSGARAESNFMHLHASHARHSSGIVSCSFQLGFPVSWAGIAAWTGHLGARFGDDLYRCKALLSLKERPGRVVVQGVRRVFEFRHDTSMVLDNEHSPIVCIGRNLDRETLRAGLAWLAAPEVLQQPISAGFPAWLGELGALAE